MTKYVEMIKDTVENNKVSVFMKGTPQNPQCGFSHRVASALDVLNVEYKSVNILEDHPFILQDLKGLYGWPTSPQLYIDGKLIGGCDIVMELYENGELQEMLGIKA